MSYLDDLRAIISPVEKGDRSSDCFRRLKVDIRRIWSDTKHCYIEGSS